MTLGFVCSTQDEALMITPDQIRCKETWSRLFLYSAACCLIGGITFWVTSGVEEIDSVIDPIAERVAQVRVACRPSSAASQRLFCEQERARARGETIEPAAPPPQQQSNPVANGAVDTAVTATAGQLGEAVGEAVTAL